MSHFGETPLLSFCISENGSPPSNQGVYTEYSDLRVQYKHRCIEKELRLSSCTAYKYKKIPSYILECLDEIVIDQKSYTLGSFFEQMNLQNTEFKNYVFGVSDVGLRVYGLDSDDNETFEWVTDELVGEAKINKIEYYQCPNN